jgi:putative ABC transport system permease protein
MFSDVRLAFRTLIKSPGFTALVLVVLALGIGATTTIFSIVDGVLLKPLPFQDASRLVSINPLVHGEPDETAYPDLQDWRATATSFDRIAAATSAPATLTGTGEPIVLNSAAVTGDFFPMLGVSPLAGRTLTAADDKPDANVAVISAALWASRFASQRDVVGRNLTLDGRPFTIVGIMPASFDYPFDTERVQLWVPVRGLALIAQFANQRGATFLHAFGHVRSGVSLSAAQAEMTTIAARLAAAYPKTNGIRSTVRLRPLQEGLVHEYRLALLVLFAAVGAVLLIACANVANLLLARGTAREKEMAVRAALGASRGRLVRQLLTESLVLSVFGGAAGVLLSLWAVSALVSASPIAIPRLHDAHVDPGVLVFAIAASMLTGLVFGSVPAVQASRARAGDTLKEAGRGSTGGRAARTRQGLVVAEVALSLVLLASAGLLARTLVALRHVDPGFVAERAVAMELSLPDARYHKATDQLAFYRHVIAETPQLPGVVAAGVSTTLPLTGSDVGMGFTVEGRPDTADAELRKSAEFYGVSPDYFRAMGMRLLSGRLFTERDDERAPLVMVIGETFAKRYWPQGDAVGHRLVIGYNSTGPREIVGVVADVKQSTLSDPAPLEMYTPYPQAPWPFMTVVARTQADPTSLAPALRGALARIDADLPAAEIKTLGEYVSRAVATPQFTAALFGVFAGLSLLLAAFGLFSVTAYAVAQRAREIGIRLALGAQPSAVRGLILSQALGMGLVGLGVGLVGALAASRLLGALLFGVGAGDPATYAAVSALLLVVMAAAAYFPARRATRVDPMIALRAE